jgi:hypothetical protein
MYTITTPLLIISLLICQHACCQQPVMSVQSFEYIWEKNSYEGLLNKSHRVIIPSTNSSGDKIRKSFESAIHRRWNAEIQEVPFTVKPHKTFSYQPKFNTKIKNKQPGIWYMFLQIFDKGNNMYMQESKYDILSATLEIKCRIINGANDSLVLDRALTVNINRQPSPGQVIIRELPAFPSYFVQAFDSIATWLFQPGFVNYKTLALKPACLFLNNQAQNEPVSQLVFDSDEKNIHHLTKPSFLFQMPVAQYVKIDAKKNVGGNIASGALTLFTGIGVNKTRVYQYRADFPFKELDTIYHCFINYAERETAEREREKVKNSDGSKSYSVESGSYTLMERRIDSTATNMITVGSDTLATFNIKYIPAFGEETTIKQFWDGSDSASVVSLPKEWDKFKEVYHVIVKGKAGDHSFLVKTSHKETVKEFYLDDRLIMIMYGKNAPARAQVFQPVSPLQLKLFTILSSLPYAYFNYHDY